jgi:lipoprotein NlpD
LQLFFANLSAFTPFASFLLERKIMSLVFSKAASTAPATIFKTFVLAAAAASALALSGCASKPQVNNSARYVAAPDFYTVRSGDTLSGIAARYGLSYVSVAEMNDIVAPYRIYVGQSLRLKNSSSRRAASTQAVTQVAPIQRQSIALPQNTTTTPSQTTVRTPVAPVTTPSTTATSNTLRWVRPSTGSVLESFNLANNVKGTRYSGNVGDAVVAAADGQVVYAADGLKE